MNEWATIFMRNDLERTYKILHSPKCAHCKRNTHKTVIAIYDDQHKIKKNRMKMNEKKYMYI